MLGKDRDRHTGADARTELRHLRDLGDFKVAKGYPDIRGWDVKTRDGRRFGTVHDLVVSPAEMRARYLDVDTDEGGHALIPIGIVDLGRKSRDVVVHELSSADFATYPRYSRRDGIGRDYEISVWRHFSPERTATPTTPTPGAAAAAATGTVAEEFGYASSRYDDRRFLADDDRDAHHPHDRDVSPSVAAYADDHAHDHRTGDGGAHPVRHEEVTIEMRPIPPGEQRSADIQIRENEVRIPLMAEGPNGERTPREEVIVRKRMVDGDRADTR
jgi:hypothetical protein